MHLKKLMCTSVLLLGLNLAILASQRWPRAADSATYLLDLHGVTEGKFLVPELVSFTRRHGPALTPSKKIAWRLTYYYTIQIFIF